MLYLLFLFLLHCFAIPIVCQFYCNSSPPSSFSFFVAEVSQDHNIFLEICVFHNCRCICTSLGFCVYIHWWVHAQNGCEMQLLSSSCVFACLTTWSILAPNGMDFVKFYVGNVNSRSVIPVVYIKFTID